MIRVELPAHLRTLSGVDGDVHLEVPTPVTIDAVLTALEAQWPVLRGAIRDHGTRRRRDFVRYFAGGRDLSLERPDAVLPPAVVRGEEPFIVLGALAGG
jgi:sulfur-carrier protein